ncbi:MAG: EAL domain-containing protein, partial [Gammaproteobacteria bacterium]|nr:EAL domain-containing protein [Gammaproteobacteria bacterium]
MKIIRSHIFLFLSLFILLSDGLFVTMNNFVMTNTLHETLKQEGQQLHNSYNTLLSRTYTNMLIMATFIASDQEVKSLFLQAKKAVKSEGGGSGGEKSQAVRQALYEKVGPNWKKVQKEFDVRQLHFHLSPGSTSFLRVHRPDKFGDNMDDIRFTIVDTNAEHKARSGFESGRVYSGLRGVVPVSAFDPQQQKSVHIGALEVGTSFNTLLKILDKQYAVGSGVLLTKKHINSVMWPDFVKQHFGESQKDCECFIEASSRDNFNTIQNHSIQQNILFLEAGTNILAINENYFSVSHFPIRDYLGTLNPERAPVGAIVFWKDINKQMTDYHNAQWFNIMYGIVSFIILELLLYFCFHFATRHLQKRVNTQTRQLKKSESRLKEAQKIGQIGHWEWNIETNQLSWSDEVYHIYGVTPINFNVTYKACLKLIHPLDREPVSTHLKEAIEKEFKIDIEHRILLANGTEKTVKEQGNVIRNSQGEVVCVIGTVQDISRQKIHQEQLEHIAHYDKLTNLPNRTLLTDRLAQAMRQTLRHDKKIAVLFLDLDGFKEINDNYGHEIGDTLLKKLAGRMEKAVREGDTVSRVGGDEFIILLVDLNSLDDCLPLLQRLLVAASSPLEINKNRLQVSASIGVTYYPQTTPLEANKLLRQADQAMYQAKVSGKNRYHFFDVKQDIKTHYETIEQVEQALVNNEFILYYQPKVNMQSGLVVGAEALIRWQHPEHGLLPPFKFLPMIENHLISINLGKWVIDTALSQIEHLNESGLELTISVNVSALQLEQDNFVEELYALINAHPKVNAKQLEIEVLETSALKDIGHITHVIKQCSEFGVHFALDDFGTGYSSLTYLKNIPATVLKIDQSFVRDMLEDPEDLAILEAIIGLATAFRRGVIAEGVETVEHGNLSLQLGCELAQGYAISKPMPADKVVDWVERWKTEPSWTKQKRIAQKDKPVLFACLEHQAWIKNITRYLDN